MGAPGAAAAIAAAAARRAEQRIIDSLRNAEATTPAKVAPLHPRRMIDRGALRRLLKTGAVVEVGTETYWFDEPAYETYKRNRERTGLIILAVVLAFVVAAAIVATIYRGI